MLETVVFDMGNVLVHFCHERMCRQIGALCGKPAPEIRALLIDSGLQASFERGEVSEQAFHQRLEELVQRRLEFGALQQAGSDIFELNREIVPILAGLKAAGYRLVLLSNTSVAHFEFIRRAFVVLAPFDAFVLSYEVGAMKPEPAIYEATLRAIECRPEAAFYTDDIPQYVAAGRRHGLQAEVFTTAAALWEQLTLRGVCIAQPG